MEHSSLSANEIAALESDELPHKSLNHAQLMLLFSDEGAKFADAKVTCKGIEWRVHQSILGTRCPFFAVCFSAGKFKEGETKTVDFGSDEPFAVEALLIYLYTLEYPSRSSQMFEEPAPNGSEATQAIASPEALVTVSKSARFKLKSDAPPALWQERLGLYHLAHRLNLRSLCRASLGIMVREISKALQCSNVAEFVTEVYSLDQVEAKRLKEDIATKIADQKRCLISQLPLYILLKSQPLFGCNLINRMTATMDRIEKDYGINIQNLRSASLRERDRRETAKLLRLIRES